MQSFRYVCTHCNKSSMLDDDSLLMYPNFDCPECKQGKLRIEKQAEPRIQVTPQTANAVVYMQTMEEITKEIMLHAKQLYEKPFSIPSKLDWGECLRMAIELKKLSMPRVLHANQRT